jgi:hypothetical protein
MPGPPTPTHPATWPFRTCGAVVAVNRVATPYARADEPTPA